MAESEEKKPEAKHVSFEEIFSNINSENLPKLSKEKLDYFCNALKLKVSGERKEWKKTMTITGCCKLDKNKRQFYRNRFAVKSSKLSIKNDFLHSLPDTLDAQNSFWKSTNVHTANEQTNVLAKRPAYTLVADFFKSSLALSKNLSAMDLDI